MKNIVRIVVVQPDIYWEEIQMNLDNYNKILVDITETDLVVLPEMFATGFTMNTKLFTKKTNEQVLEWLKAKAHEFSCAFLAGTGFVENGKYFNRVFFIDSTEEINIYNKRHLFSHGKEDVHYNRGNERKIIDFKGWKIFPQICYDLRFPVWSRNNMDYNLLINVANWPAIRNEHWLTLLKARAIENQAYVIGVNRVGHDGNNINYIGNSCCFRFDGKELFNMGEKRNIYQSFTLDKPELLKYRKDFDVLKDSDHFEWQNHKES